MKYTDLIYLLIAESHIVHMDTDESDPEEHLYFQQTIKYKPYDDGTGTRLRSTMMQTDYDLTSCAPGHNWPRSEGRNTDMADQQVGGKHTPNTNIDFDVISTTPKTKTGFMNLPTEIITQIVKLTEPEDIHICRQVSRRLNQIIMSEIWNTVRGKNDMEIKLSQRIRQGKCKLLDSLCHDVSHIEIYKDNIFLVPYHGHTVKIYDRRTMELKKILSYIIMFWEDDCICSASMSDQITVTGSKCGMIIVHNNKDDYKLIYNEKLPMEDVNLLTRVEGTTIIASATDIHLYRYTEERHEVIKCGIIQCTTTVSEIDLKFGKLLIAQPKMGLFIVSLDEVMRRIEDINSSHPQDMLDVTFCRIMDKKNIFQCKFITEKFVAAVNDVNGGHNMYPTIGHEFHLMEITGSQVCSAYIGSGHSVYDKVRTIFYARPQPFPQVEVDEKLTIVGPYIYETKQIINRNIHNPNLWTGILPGFQASQAAIAKHRIYTEFNIIDFWK